MSKNFVFNVLQNKINYNTNTNTLNQIILSNILLNIGIKKSIIIIIILFI